MHILYLAPESGGGGPSTGVLLAIIITSIIVVEAVITGFLAVCLYAMNNSGKSAYVCTTHIYIT